MIVSIPEKDSLYWGNPVLVNISNVISPVETENFQVIVRLEKIINQIQTSLVYSEAMWPDNNNEIHIDLSHYIRSVGNYKLQFGESYDPIIGAELGNRESYFIPELEETLSIVNGTIVETDYYTIPMGAVQLSGNPIQIIVPTAPELILGKSSFKRL